MEINVELYCWAVRTADRTFHNFISWKQKLTLCVCPTPRDLSEWHHINPHQALLFFPPLPVKACLMGESPTCRGHYVTLQWVITDMTQTRQGLRVWACVCLCFSLMGEATEMTSLMPPSNDCTFTSWRPCPPWECFRVRLEEDRWPHLSFIWPFFTVSCHHRSFSQRCAVFFLRTS